MKSIHNIYLLLTLLAATNLAAQNRYFVNHAATGANTGATWADAFTDLQAALVFAQSGDEVWVAQGTYRPTPGTDRKISFEPKSRVRLYGGFAGTETDLAQRDWQAHPTVLSGDIGVPGDSTDNSYNVVFWLRPDEGSALDGFIIRHGNADDAQAALFSTDRAICGGGLYIMAQNGEAYPDIRNCRFERNTAHQSGGAVMVNAGANGSALPVFDNCTLADNRSVRNGGGMARFGGSWEDRGPFLRDCRFERNSAGQRGGGLYYTASSGTDSLMLHDCVFEENSAWIAGGGAFFSLGRPEIMLLNATKTIFSANYSAEGSAISLFPNGSFSGSILIDSCVFNKNSSNSNPLIPSAPVLYFSLFGSNTYSSSIFIKNNVFSENSSKSIMTLFECENSFFNLENNYFTENYSANSFAVRYINSSEFSKLLLEKNVFFKNYDVNLFLNISSLSKIENATIENTIFALNKLKKENGLSNVLIDCSTFNQIDFSIKNTDFIKNNASVFSINRPLLHVNIVNSVFQDTAHINYFPLGWNTPTLLTHSYFDTLNCAALPASVTCGPGLIIGGDPMFVNPDSGDYRLQACSPLLNAGSNAYVSTPTDLAGNPRIHDGTVDIGAYEHQGPALVADPDVQPSCPGGASGGIGIEVLDACPPVAVAWQSGAASGTALTGLPPGAYQITVTDANGMSLVLSAVVPEGDAPELLPLPTPVACGDTLGGSAAAAVSGAPGPFAFDWGPLGADSLLTGLPPGLYPVTVTDARGCTAAGSVQVERSGNLSVSVDAQAVSCHGSADGAFTVLPANGKPPFAWNWSNPPGATTPTVAPLGPGTYEGTLTDAFGCTIGWVLPLGQPAPLLPNPFVTDASDSSSSDGSILLIPGGGTGPYEAMWSNGGTGLLQDGLPPGAYFATVTDANGCTATTPVILVGVTSATAEPYTAADWQVLPNPASEVAEVVLGAPAPADLPVRLWAADGRLVWQGLLPAGAQRLALPVAGLPGGVYVVEVAGSARRVEKR